MIIVGLIGEAIAIVFISSGPVEKAVSLVCTLVIAFGVWVEEAGGEATEAEEKAESDLRLWTLGIGTSVWLTSGVKDCNRSIPLVDFPAQNGFCPSTRSGHAASVNGPSIGGRTPKFTFVNFEGNESPTSA
jgi:hypothetical protein